MKSKILLTGASGFVGRSLATKLADLGLRVRAPVRSQLEIPGVETVPIDAIDADTAWGKHLKGIETVIHCAGRAHRMNELFAASLPEYRRVNVDGTLNLARQAADAGVKRFIFLSSVKVNGEQSLKGQPLRESDVPQPQNPYAISKYEAEQGLIELGRNSGMEVVIIRPTLIYGPGVKANFFTMLRLVRMGMPLPFGAIENMRSFTYLENLLDLIVRCIDHPQAANQVFFCSDGYDLSTTELLRCCGAAMGVSVYLLPVPQNWCMLSASLLGQGDAIQRLCGSLQVDISKARRLLDWKPPVSVQVGLQHTVQEFI